ncbi:MAG: zinc-binding alcohol dehydrogenase family protein [Bacteroidales bacterium]|nr:zinc-binding alcohol dehydrogenase family protein [Bacteroidales bacterium]
MKAFTFIEPGTIAKININEPSVGQNDVLVEVHYIGLCGSDLASYLGLMPMVTYPRIPGHEISGKIIGKGDNVPNTYKIGDNVTVSPYTNCGICPACRIGRINACEFNQTFGVQRDGALTEKIAVPYEKVFVSKTLTLKELALVEPLSVGYHGANIGAVAETDTVLLFGCGTIGMGALLASARKGATIIAVDIDDSKLAQAKKFGATYTINALKENVKTIVAKITNNEGVNVAIEAAGIPETLVMALDLVSFAGRVVTIGYSKKDVSLNTQVIVRKELRIFGSRNALNVFHSVIKMFERKEKSFTDIITKIFPFDETEKAFKFWVDNKGTVSKILISLKE